MLGGMRGGVGDSVLGFVVRGALYLAALEHGAAAVDRRHLLLGVPADVAAHEHLVVLLEHAVAAAEEGVERGLRESWVLGRVSGPFFLLPRRPACS